ncbi:DUF3127 domain-containing protein [Lentimicrobium sp.]|jgi:hypothetical protein|uniref:DUF3127 domain-containing protein n=1 Tax=Lentimicrobium sp. TaxID=2034841 RepID=UPI0025F3D126|nr:DUF3127 domain-containing protein [Lentimicrobium sp.]MCO5255301.1 DUF3127 domain-containing protein [Lentimicrobium sp.]MCO5262441.1 DUF3127 domain-containing protein [Lentimicrobium sp.]HOP13259.1 DUF3127 domain-containing protein [Lentimicrobium sp.]HPF64500.1 DUF3127 domain-containing protein [Lentimicrobium sp.]HPJ62359.1 DUF3127 domain-containing protein [Lentimicrobium sp.]
MAFEITGKLIEKFETQNVSEKFKKREFVIEFRDNPNSSFTEMLKFQLTQDRCSLIDAYNTGQDIRLWFNLRGRKWEKDGNVNYFTNLEAWKIEGAAAAPEQQAGTSLPDSGTGAAAADELTNDLPF